MRHQVTGVKDHCHHPLIMTSPSQPKKSKSNKAGNKNKQPEFRERDHGEHIEVANLDAFDEVDEILAASNVNERGRVGLPLKPRPTLTRSQTLPSIVIPGLTILQAQIESTYQNKNANRQIPHVVEPAGDAETATENTPDKVRNDASLVLRPHGNSPGENHLQPEVHDLLGMSAIRRLSGSSEPGASSSSSSSGARDKRSSVVLAPPAGPAAPVKTPQWLPKFRNSVKSEKASPSTSRNVSPNLKSPEANRIPWNSQAASPSPSPTPQLDPQLASPPISRLRRRHSLESNNDLVGLFPKLSGGESGDQGLLANHPPPDVTAGATSAVGRPRMTLTLPVLDLRPSSPGPGGLKRTKSSERKKDPRNRESSLGLLVSGLNVSKGDLKKMEKLTNINIHLHALFAAVEFGQVEKARAILEDNEVDTNSCNGDGLSLLDVAVLTHNTAMVKTLVAFGAREGAECGSKEALSLRLIQLLSEAEKQLEEKGISSLGTLIKADQDKHIALWKRRARILRKMKAGLDQLKLPHSPNQSRVEVIGESAAQLWWLQPEMDSGGITTKFKVQWSTHPDFVVLGGEVELRDLLWKSEGNELNEIKTVVSDLPSGARCYFRVAAGNLAGYGSFKPTLPPSVFLSAWRSLDGRKPRFAGRLPILDDLFSKVCSARPDYASEVRQLEDGSGETPVKQQKKNQTKINLRQFFGANVKFHKNLRRGVYFACIVYHEDKILVTTEEFPPVVEVDDTYPASVNNDFHWLMKVGCTWSDVKTLRQDMERSLSSSNAHFRIKLLQAVAQLQTALGLQDLGQLYYQPLKDSQGTMVISTTFHLASIKAMPSSLNFKWLPLSKLQQRRLTGTGEDCTAGDLLLASLQEQIDFLQVSNRPLQRGLYIGYLKLKSSVDLIRVLVPKAAPNLVPHAKIRDNPWVSSEEWQWLRKLAAANQPPVSKVNCGAGVDADGVESGADHPVDARASDVDADYVPSNLQPTTAQLLFQSQLQRAAKKLLHGMGMEETLLQHRIFDDEVIELSPEVSLILLLPPPDSVCAVAGQSEALFHRPEFLSVPVQVFEMIHLRTYQRDLIGRYSRLSSILELDSNLAQLAMREAFSSLELSEAKQRIVRLQDLQTQVDTTWRGSRWIMDVVSVARDRTVTVGVAISSLSQQQSGALVPIVQYPATPTDVPEEPAVNHPPPIISAESRPSPGKMRLLIKAKSDNKLLASRNLTPESLVMGRNQLARSRSPVCGECSVPLDLPGYVTNCEACACSRARFSQPGTAETVKQHSRSNEALPTPPTLHFSGQNGCSRKAISRSENQLHSMDFQPFLDAEGSDSTPVSAAPPPEGGQPNRGALPPPPPPPPPVPEMPVSNSPAGSTGLMNAPPPPPPGPLLRGGSKKGLGSSMRSNSQESECSRHSRSSHTPSLTSLSSADGDPDSGSIRSADVESCDATASGIIQVYAAYESGLANGTSVKLHVTARTTAREVVDLVVRQLNMAVVLKGKEGPVYSAEELKNFCLVAVIGARERCLRDDFRPLHLQNPWKTGRLFVRQKKDVTAAIEQSARQPPPAVL